eukprot:1832345-Prymnesium_polylepis.1
MTLVSHDTSPQEMLRGRQHRREINIWQNNTNPIKLRNTYNTIRQYGWKAGVLSHPAPRGCPGVLMYVGRRCDYNAYFLKKPSDFGQGL